MPTKLTNAQAKLLALFIEMRPQWTTCAPTEWLAGDSAECYSVRQTAAVLKGLARLGLVKCRRHKSQPTCPKFTSWELTAAAAPALAAHNASK